MMMMPPQPLLAIRWTANVTCRSVSMGALVTPALAPFCVTGLETVCQTGRLRTLPARTGSRLTAFGHYTGTPDATHAGFVPPYSSATSDNTIRETLQVCTPLRLFAGEYPAVHFPLSSGLMVKVWTYVRKLLPYARLPKSPPLWQGGGGGVPFNKWQYYNCTLRCISLHACTSFLNGKLCTPKYILTPLGSHVSLVSGLFFWAAVYTLIHLKKIWCPRLHCWRLGGLRMWHGYGWTTPALVPFCVAGL